MAASLDELRDNVWVINLDARPDRWERFVRHVAEVDWPFGRFARFRAVDGRLAPPPAWWRQGSGAWGCLQSHVRVIETALMDRRKAILVLEDDACFPADLRQRVERLAEVPDDWDQVYLGGQHLYQARRPPTDVSPGVLRPFIVNRTHAYALRGPFLPTVYRWLTDYVTLAARPRHHVDLRLGELHQTGQHNVYAPREWLAGQYEGQSNINGKSMPTRWWPSWSKMGEDLPPFVAVIGLHRSGSSCTAGVLHKLGVHMGDRLIGYEKTGGFEGIGLARACEAAYPFPQTELQIPEQELRRRLAVHVMHVRHSARARGLEAAGGKYPQLCAVGPLLKDICGDALRVIHINRPLEESVRSLQTRSRACGGRLHVPDDAAERVQRWLWERKESFLASMDHLTIEYRDLLQDPRREIERIIAYLGLSPSAERVEAAWSHVTPALCRHGAA